MGKHPVKDYFPVFDFFEFFTYLFEFFRSQFFGLKAKGFYVFFLCHSIGYLVFLLLVYIAPVALATCWAVLCQMLTLILPSRCAPYFPSDASL